MKQDIIVAIRAHKVDNHLLNTVNELENRSNIRCLVLLHDENEVIKSDERFLCYSSQTIESMGLTTYNRNDWAWHMGDLAFYHLFENTSECEFALFIEYDVKVNFDLNKVINASSGIYDFVALYAGFESPSWFWYDSAKKWFDRALGSFFPIVGLSRSLGSAAYKKRMEMAKLWRQRGCNPQDSQLYAIHCEAFVPSVCGELGLSMCDISTIVDNWDSQYFTLYGLFPWEISSLDHIPAIHPCFPATELTKVHSKIVNNNSIPEKTRSRIEEEFRQLLRLGIIRLNNN